MAYSLVITPRAEKQFVDIVEYLAETLNNAQAATSVADDVVQTYRRLMYIMDAFPPRHKFKFGKLKFYIIRLKKHRYFIVYRLRGDEILVEGIFHNSQDYRKRFLDD